MASRNYFRPALMCSLLIGCLLSPAFAAGARVGDIKPGEAESTPLNAFPAAEPEQVGIPSAALERLRDHLRQLVEQQRIVGGELLVIKSGRTVLNMALGWKDRDAELALQSGALYCVRSMTKPVVGTAIQLLIDQGRLQLNTLLKDILPAFDSDATGKITIEHLLTHSAGFPLSTMRQPMSAYRSLDQVAAEAASADLQFKPGEGFQYSDASADILGAVVAEVSGMPLEQFIQKHLLDPLQMAETVMLLSNHPEQMARIPSAYSGGTGAWNKHWGPSDPPLFPIFLGSQGLYSTTQDYAKFLSMWMDDGRWQGKQLLSPLAVRRALEPAHKLTGDPYPTSAAGGETGYAQQWMVRTEQDDVGNRKLSMFGHDGSDGTHAWVWPEQQLIVLFFTQSRLSNSGGEVASQVERLLIEQQLVAEPQAVATPQAGETGIAGLYWDADAANAYYVISERDGRVELDRPGGMHVVFKRDPDSDRYLAEANRKIWIAFDRDETGQVLAMRTFFGKREERDPRHVPDPALPSVQTLVERSQGLHRMDQLKRTGAVRLSGRINYVDRKMKGRLKTTFDFERSRVQAEFGGARQITMTDGDRAWSKTSATGLDELSGLMREQVRIDRFPVLLGDWRQHFKAVSVLKRVQFDQLSLIMLRTTPHVGADGTLYLDEATGRLIRHDGLVLIPGVGIVGVQTMFDDYREVDGMQIPFKSKSKFQHPMIGIVEVSYDKVEVGVATSAATFVPAPSKPKAG